MKRLCKVTTVAAGLISVFLICVGCAGLRQPAESLSARSPDGKLEMIVRCRGALEYSVKLDGQPLLADSRLGLDFRGNIQLGRQVELVKVTRNSHNSIWTNPWGKRREVRDRYNELTLVFRELPYSRSFGVVFRLYNDGLGFRYLLTPETGIENFILERDCSQFTFVGDFKCFAGKQDGGFQGAQEWEFKPGKLSEIKQEAIIGLPLLVQTPAAWVAIAEADLRDWSGMWLGGSPEPAKGPSVAVSAKLAPRKDGLGVVTGTVPRHSPWRVLIVGRQPGRLMESDLVLNLSSPCELADTSWIRPGKMAWDHWWSGDVKMDTATIKQYVQLAADMGWPYQLIDWQWYGEFNKPGSDITKVNPALDMEEVRRFAKDKNVKLWVWLYHTDVDRNDICEKAFALYERWGIVGVKIDFMDRDDQDMVNWYERITRKAAEHHLMVNFHGAFKTSGFNRTFPNQITREGILGNEYNRWSTRVTPEHKLMLPFTRFLEGPADFTPGGFLNRQPGQFKADPKACQVQGTRAAELALFVVYESPLCCVCDHPSHYKDQPGTDFLKIVPTVWEDTLVLNGEPGQRLLIARRSGKEWFLGGLTDSKARELEVDFGFLKRGHWQLQLWKDAPDSDVHAEHLATESRSVAAFDKVKVKLAPAGGFVARIVPQNL